MHTVEEQRGRRGKCPGLILIDEWGTWNPSRNLGSHRLEQPFVGSLTRAQLYQGTQGLFREILDRDLNTHTHTQKQRVLGTPSCPLLLLHCQPHAKTPPHRACAAGH